MLNEQLRPAFDQAQVQVNEITAVRPPRGVPVDQRAAANALVRERLGLASNLAVATLTARGHQLSRAEMIRRFRGEQPVELLPCVSLINTLCSTGLFRGNRVLVDLATDNIERYTPTAPQEEVVDVVGGFAVDIIGRDTSFLSLILSLREDPNAIYNEILNRVKTTSHPDAFGNFKLRLDFLQQQSGRIKAERAEAKRKEAMASWQPPSRNYGDENIPELFAMMFLDENLAMMLQENRDPGIPIYAGADENAANRNQITERMQNDGAYFYPQGGSIFMDYKIMRDAACQELGEATGKTDQYDAIVAGNKILKSRFNHHMTTDEALQTARDIVESWKWSK